jgi:hypothetical protein
MQLSTWRQNSRSAKKDHQGVIDCCFEVYEQVPSSQNIMIARDWQCFFVIRKG